jgi:flagellar biosynthesis protein FlhF
MQIKKFTANTIEEARSMVERELGKDAIILHTKKVTKGGPFHFLKHEMIELTAALGDPESFGAPNGGTSSFSSSLLSAYHESEGPFSTQASGQPDYHPDPSSSVDLSTVRSELRELREEISGLRTVVEGVSRNLRYLGMPALPEHIASFFVSLIDVGIDEPLSKEIVQRLYQSLHGEPLEDTILIEKHLLSIMSRMIRTAAPSVRKEHGPLIEIFVGPTGVGKTTTLAKLAMRRDLFGAKTVAILSADNFRLAATEQLKIFAGLIDAPLEVVYTSDEIRRAIDTHRDKDLILIDTAGRSQSDADQFAALRDLVRGVEPDDVHLVLSATAKTSDLLSAFRRYQTLPVTRVIFTKLDETTSLGTLFNFAVKAGEPVSFISFGQNIPEDINPVTSEEISKIILQNGI